MIAAWLTVLGGCQPVDPDDCRVVDAEDCEVYRPQGLVCGLVHAGFEDHPGSACTDLDPAATSGFQQEQEAPCPEGFSLSEVADEDAEDNLVFCQADGNANTSSADLAEVATDAVCGLNSTRRRGTHNLCEGMDPVLGECPEGFSWRFAIESYNDSGSVLEEEEGQAHLLVWCELEDGGCDWEDCADPVDPLCGLHGRYWLGVYEEAWESLPPSERNAGLQVALESVPDHGLPDGQSCQGAAVSEDRCPEGLALACTYDAFGETQYPDAYCWCTAESAVRTPSGPGAN